MGNAINLMDPEFEPTDEQLEGLMREAFAGLKERHEASLEKMRAKIRQRGAEVMADLRARGVIKST